MSTPPTLLLEYGRPLPFLYFQFGEVLPIAVPEKRSVIFTTFRLKLRLNLLLIQSMVLMGGDLVLGRVR